MSGPPDRDITDISFKLHYITSYSSFMTDLDIQWSIGGLYYRAAGCYLPCGCAKAFTSILVAFSCA
jgi:hypothetical protein